jgi:hypothetical protein
MTEKKRKPLTSHGLLKETCYFYEDELEEIAEAARRERCSRAEIVRRAVRAYLELKQT